MVGAQTHELLASTLTTGSLVGAWLSSFSKSRNHPCRGKYLDHRTITGTSVSKWMKDNTDNVTNI